MTRNILVAVVIAMMSLACGPTVHAQSSTTPAAITSADWAAYRQRFLDPSGRIVDDANKNISHSEGQGYGLLLAFLAGDQASFDLIWSFTRDELLLRNDQLAAWKWDPAARPHVQDPNNATDGDILIAYALARAGTEWQAQDKLATARTMIHAIGKSAVIEQQGRYLILPGVEGYSSRDRPEDGPIINLSYWIFEAFPLFAELDSGTDWTKLSKDGLALLRQARFGPHKLPANWISMRTRARPAAGFPEEFGYDALRIPLYLARADHRDPELLRALADGMSADGGVAVSDVDSGTIVKVLSDPGYRIIPALVACELDGKAIPDDLRQFVPTNYFPATLQLLALAATAGRDGGCR